MKNSERPTRMIVLMALAYLTIQSIGMREVHAADSAASVTNAANTQSGALVADVVAALKKPEEDAAVLGRYLKAGGNPNACSDMGEPLIVLAEPDTGKTLLNAGADPRAANKRGNTALHEVANGFYLDSYLGGFGGRTVNASITIPSDGPATVATDKDPKSLWKQDDANKAFIPKFEYIELLLEKGADINATNSVGQTALDLAIANLRMSGVPDEQMSTKPYMKFLKDKGAKALYVPKQSNQPLTEQQKSFQDFMKAMQQMQQ